jgi:hypothetical protein
MHYMQAMHAVMSEEAEYRLFTTEHDYHLGLQDRMRHPIAVPGWGVSLDLVPLFTTVIQYKT